MNCAAGRGDIKQALFACGRLCSHFICLKRVISHRTTGRPVGPPAGPGGSVRLSPSGDDGGVGVTSEALGSPISPLLSPTPPHPPPASSSPSPQICRLSLLHTINFQVHFSRRESPRICTTEGVDYTVRRPTGEAGSILEDRFRL